MEFDARATSGSEVIEAASARQIRGDAACGDLSPMAQVISDPGKIRLGGAWRLPASRTAG